MRVSNETAGHNFCYGITSNSGNMYVEDFETYTKLYSYNSLLAIKFKKENVILISERIASYSNTSCKHNIALRHAISIEILISVNEISYLGNYDKAHFLTSYLNKVDLRDKISNHLYLLKKQKKARKYNYSLELRRNINNMQNIVKFGKIDKRSKEYKTFNQIINNINLDDLLKLSIEAEKKAKLIQANNSYKRNLKSLENFTETSLKHYSKTDINSFHFLKIQDNKLFTSGGLNVPLTLAKILYKAFLNGNNIIGEKIEHYTILSVSKKSIKIGCHNILISELKRVLS